MKANYKTLIEKKGEGERPASVCFYKDNHFWIYHTDQIDDNEQEKANPADKLWLVMRHMSNDKEHNLTPGHGYKLEIGDIVKFGRVRYKVIELHNHHDGHLKFSLMDRFQKRKFEDEQKRLVREKGDVRVKRRKGRRRKVNVGPMVVQSIEHPLVENVNSPSHRSSDLIQHGPS